MATKKKMLQAAAGAAGGDQLLAIEDVFNTYLYTGQSAFSVVNGIDMETHGGAVWIKNRTSVRDHRLFSTGLTNLGYHLTPNSTSGENNLSFTGITSFNSDGWSVGTGNSETNNTGFGDYTSWTFRKAPRFFDVVPFTTTYNVNPNVISHNLEGELGCAIFKQLNSTGQGENWIVYHRSLGNGKYLRLNETASTITDAQSFVSVDNEAGTISFGYPMANVADRLVSGGTETTNWVGYFFAHDPLGPSEDGSDGLIACGSFTSDGSGSASVSLGWEPQWIIYKRSDGTSNWGMNDIMRGWADTYWNPLYADASNAESGFSANRSWPTATGFAFNGQLSASANYIYIAIRRGPMRAPTSATEVFALQQDDAGDGNAPAFRSGFPVDFAIERIVNTSGSNYIVPRLTAPNFLKTDNNQPQNHGGANPEYVFDYNNGWNSTAAQSAKTIAYMWKRAPQFCDVVAYTGSGGAGRTVSHNLGVAPEMMWIKRRDQLANWYGYHTGTDATAPEDYTIRLDIDQSAVASAYLNNTAPSSSDFTTGTVTNASGGTYVAYLFASLSGVSKVGGYTGDGTSGRIIDCGFTSGARFILIRRIDALGSWILWDSVRGIADGNDPYIALDTTDVEVTTADYIDPHASGFMVNNNVRTNTSGATYVFYAVA